MNYEALKLTLLTHICRVEIAVAVARVQVHSWPRLSCKAASWPADQINGRGMAACPKAMTCGGPNRRAARTCRRRTTTMDWILARPHAQGLPEMAVWHGRQVGAAATDVHVCICWLSTRVQVQRPTHYAWLLLLQVHAMHAPMHLCSVPGRFYSSITGQNWVAACRFRRR
jgi:hypothetical protein